MGESGGVEPVCIIARRCLVETEENGSVCQGEFVTVGGIYLCLPDQVLGFCIFGFDPCGQCDCRGNVQGFMVGCCCQLSFAAEPEGLSVYARHPGGAVGCLGMVPVNGSI